MLEADAVVVMTTLMEALTICHWRGVAHRDMKLDNVLFDGEGRLRLEDFGLIDFFKDELDRFEIICDDMEGKSLRRYVKSNLSDMDWLRHDLKSSIDLINVAISATHPSSTMPFRLSKRMMNAESR
ncbi:CBL-interacting serine/threonine-protein kinase 24-like [Phalaenopsis equestris]|uniref:CBL-interacting serine/threonine-protein kinase 24-like n=1 Tax=Phalaenopsis equestris TaxID=78828 RepID=UPI0009E51380|nr:CBL-interacting serine/threonine-protein kinase 24-like [Phalaenopsis equestris]